ncbi:hypothetical protein FRC04_002769 [Tulasnella sp. 424]|nr:hypothetical protein FRC04_002769 [Tulasnella sp. 424]
MLFRAPLLAVAAALLAHQVSANGGRSVTCDPGHYHDSFLNCRECPDNHFYRQCSVQVFPAPSMTTTDPERISQRIGGPQAWRLRAPLAPLGKDATALAPRATIAALGSSQLEEVGANDALLVKPTRAIIKDAKSARLERTHLPVARARLVPRVPSTMCDAGAKACCACCAGWYSSGTTSCAQCPSNKKYSAVGSNDKNDCQATRSQGMFLPQLPNPATSCGMVADNVCPNPTGNGPQGTAISRKRRDVQCTNGFEACPRYSGNGGSDCIDTENDPESCGGCLGLDGEGPGTDCTAIKGVSVTRCVKKSCVIDSCRKGWVKSLDGTSCVVNSHSTGSSESDDLHVQDTDAKKRRSSAKRAIRGNRDIF